jgi:hypothetical protein
VFSERLKRRSLVWWGKPNKWRNRESYRHLLHRLKENYTLRSRDDPEARWHCCDFWQRTLSNKWNAREFVQRHGVRVPDLYWHGRRVGGLRLDALPEHFVLRPVVGDSRRGVYVFAGETELLREKRYTKDSLMSELQRTRGRLSRFPLLVEEFVRTERGEYQLPVEYKCHTFGETIGAIEVIKRVNDATAMFGFYSPEWKRFEDKMNAKCVLPYEADPPQCLDEILTNARRLGVLYGTYVRIDCYATNRGCVFGEFSTTPDAGRGFTPFAEQYFEDLWQATFPNRT